MPSTRGSHVGHRWWFVASFALLCGALVAASILLLASRSQAKAPPAPLAQIVFSNGGRLLTVNADGSDRKVIFGKARKPENSEFGAVNPEVSPDGKRLAFAFLREAGEWEYSDIWLAKGDGTGSKRILKGTRNTYYGDPTFTPAGDLVVAYFKDMGRRAEAGLVKVGDRGKLGRKLFVMRQRARRFQDWKYIRDARFSPDGLRILYGITEGSYPNAYSSSLRILDRRTGRSRLLVKRALDGAWSPDGSRIVYTALTWDEDAEVCGSGAAVCRDGGRLRIISYKGTGSRPVVSTGGDQRSPDWSGDGRIVFQSAGNTPNAAEAYETFSVKPGGACLTMLTNGTPASTSPFWIDPKDAVGESKTAPADCGAQPMLTLEVRKPAPGGLMTDMFWAGQKSGSMLFTSIFRDGRLPYLEYLDCSEQTSDGCGKPFYIGQAPLCEAATDLPSVVAGKPARTQRGVPVYTATGREIGQIVYMLAGRFAIYILGGSKGGVREVNALRSLSETGVQSDLPPPRFPAAGIRRMKKVQKAFESTGSVRKAANRLGFGVRLVRENLALARNIRRYGDYEIDNCR